MGYYLTEDIFFFFLFLLFSGGISSFWFHLSWLRFDFLSILS